jgi:hypothetical protein
MPTRIVVAERDQLLHALLAHVAELGALATPMLSLFW